MPRSFRGPLLVGVVLAGYALLAGMLHWATSGLLAAVRAPGPAPWDLSLGMVAGLAGWAVLSWLALATVGTVLSLTGRGRPDAGWRRTAARITPELVRRLAALALGASLVGGTVSSALPAAAAPVTAPAATAGVEPAETAEPPGPRVPPGWSPDRPAAPPRVRPPAPVRLVASQPQAQHAVVDEVVVRRGDTLWDIAARHLGSAAAVEVAAEWPRWYAANRELIGPDPDYIQPGQRLRPPAGDRP